ncbi:MAG: cupin domain-containing protein [Pseudomonadota bacterium]
MNISWPQGIDTEVFLQQYWQQKPLLIKNAFPDFDNPLDENELAGLALDDDANARFIECVDGHEWRLSHGPFDCDFFDGISGHQWSLLISDVEKLLPDFRHYLQPFRFIPDWRIDDLMISYAPVGGSVGAHIDQYDVFLLQASGEREWQIETSPRQPTTHNLNSSIALLGDFNADETYTLGAGDMLYLPPKYAHHGIAVTDPCMTWSVGFRAPSTDEMLPSLVTYLLEELKQPQRFEDAGRAVTQQPGLISDSDFSEIRRLVRNALQTTDTALDKCIGRYLSEPPAHELPDPLEVTVDALFNHRNQSLQLHCNSAHTLAYKLDADNALLFANGECFAVSQTLAETLSSQRAINLADVLPQDQQAITALVNQHTLLDDET